MPDNALISVIIPAYNAEKLIGDAVQSVLAQTYAPVEAIIVDDGSTDGTWESIQGYGDTVRVFTQENKGISGARNTAIAKARGDFLAFLDHDDLWESNKLELQMKVFHDNPQVDVVFTHLVQMRMTFKEDGTLPLEGEPLAVQAGCLPSCMLIKTSAFHRVGHFNPEVDVAEFLEWYTRAKEATLNEYMMHEVLVKRRQHGRNHSHTNGQLHYARVLKEWIDKKKAHSSTS